MSPACQSTVPPEGSPGPVGPTHAAPAGGAVHNQVGGAIQKQVGGAVNKQVGGVPLQRVKSRCVPCLLRS